MFLMYLVGIKEEYNKTIDFPGNHETTITTESTHLFFSNGISNYMITIKEIKECGEKYDVISREWTDYYNTRVNVVPSNGNFYKNLLPSFDYIFGEPFNSDYTSNEHKFDSIEDCYGSPTFYEQNRVLYNSTNLWRDTKRINVIIDKKNITLINIDYDEGTVHKKYNELFSAHLKFSPTKYFFQKMNFGYFANNQDIIRTIYLLIVRFANIKNSSMYLPKEIWEECILKMIVW